MNWRTIAVAPLAVGLTLSTLSTMMPTSAIAATKKIPSGTIAQILNKGLDVSEVRLNSFGAQHGNSWHKPNDSYINLYGFVRKFNLDEQTFRGAVLKRRMYVYNVANITSNKVTIKPHDKTFKLDVVFEGNGYEIKGMCRREKLTGGYRDCVAGEDKGAPDIQWKNNGITVTGVPYARKGGIAFKVTDVNVAGEFQANGICSLGKDICDRVTDYKSRIKKSIAEAVEKQVNDDKIQDKMADVSRQGLSSLGVPAIKGLSMQNGFVEIEY